MQIEGAASQLPCEELLDIQNLESQWEITNFEA